MATNKELKAAIYEELAKAGYNKKQIKVSAKASMYDDCVNITIEDLTIPKKKVEEIAKEFSSVRYDERTQEVLQGCNVYVRVQYDYDKWEENRKQYEQQAKEIIERFNNQEIEQYGRQSIYIIENDTRFLYHNDVMWIHTKEYGNTNGKGKHNPRIWDVMELLAQYYLGHFESIEEWNEYQVQQAIEDEKRMKQYEIERQESEKQAKAWECKRKESQRLIEEESRLFKLEEKDQTFMNNARWANCNKNSTLKEYQQQCDNFEYYTHDAKVTHIWQFDNWFAWRALTVDGFLTDFDKIKGLGGSETNDPRVNSDEDYRKMTQEERQTVKWFNLVILAYFEDMAVLIDPQGFSYCRYVALFDGYTEGKKAAKQAHQILHDGEYTNKIDRYYQSK